jgi:hypothetical protein
VSERAFLSNYDYYRLKKSCLGLDAGAIFYHDKEDRELGSLAAGCLKLAWDADGNCDFGTCSDTYILHACAINDIEYLEKVNISKEEDFILILLDKFNKWLEHSENSERSMKSGYSEGEISAYRRVIDYINTLQSNRKIR